MDEQAPKRWDRKRRRERDRRLRWKAFWAGLLVFVLALMYLSLQYGFPWPP